MNWQYFVDESYVVNLEKRYDRLVTTFKIFNQYGIRAKRFNAIKNNVGYVGLIETMQKLFSQCLKNGYEKVMIFEDDINILVDVIKFNKCINSAVANLPNDFSMLYLGVNHPEKFTEKYSGNLLRIKKGYSTHAVIYNRDVMQLIVDAQIKQPLDVWLADNIHPFKKCFCTYPLLISQRNTYSDINSRIKDWSEFIEKRFEENTLLL